MNIKKIFPLLLATTLVAGSFAGCSNKASGSKESSTNKAANEVTVFTYKVRDENSQFGTLFKNFTEKTGIKVKLQTIQGDMSDYEKKIDISLMSGDTTDVFFTTNQISQAKYALNGSILPLDDVAEQNKYDLVKNYGKYLYKVNGKNYGIPSSPTYWSVFYNKKIFDDAGVPYPTGYWTWDQYISTAKKLTNPAKKIYGSFMNDFDANFYMIATQKGISGYKKDGTSNFDDPAFADSLKFYGDLGSNLKVQPSYLEYESKKLPAESFVNGNYGMCFTGTWLFANLTDTTKYPRDWKWGITQVPVPDANSKNNVGAVGYTVINKNSKNKEAAFKLATYIGENQYKITNELPALQDFSKDNYLKLFSDIASKSGNSVTSKELYDALINNGLGFKAEKITGSIPSQYKAIIKKEVPLYLSGQKPAKDITAEIKKQADVEIKSAQK
ncbi:extracellular solute-binding protein [Clostridium estertheticum]|uniref:ABC transporter substrate-binding protein n=1 Tax=Clostridium estertheticum TaxID=238834 RepID=UPI001C0DA816|nr:extracellular solute-binding protein [Clostridium estertheticum]MBU3201928.1 extracellular solute-binding protein [Clostridium estertheticum]WAG67829.1 extracellular solute-binding protein [Clostridium estertheticum]